MSTTRVTGRRWFMEDSIVIWFNNSGITEDQSTTEQIQRIVHAIHFFVDQQKMFDFIREIKTEQVFLIMSGNVDVDVITSVHNLDQITSIYILSETKSSDQNCWKKVKGIFDSLEDLCQSMRQMKKILEQSQTAITISTLNLKELDPSFMYSQLLKDVLLDIQYDDNDKDAFIAFAKANYFDNHRAQQMIEEFKQDNQHSPIWWYTRECFLYPMLNRALRIQDIDVLHKLGFFIRDLHRQLHQLHMNTPLQAQMKVYRGQGLTHNDFTRIQSTPNGIISFNHFLSTSRDEEVARARAEATVSSTELVAILFCMTIDPYVATAPFAPVDNESFYGSNEQEVLFSMNTIFRIVAIESLEANLFRIELTLIRNDDKQMHQLTQYLHDEIRVNDDPLLRFGQLALRMGEWLKAKEIYEIKLEKAMLAQNTEAMAHFHHQLGYVYNRLDDFDKALKYLRRSLDILIQNGKINVPDSANTYSMIGEILLEQGTNVQAALYNMQHALEIRRKTFNKDPQTLAKNHSQIGTALLSLQRHDEALVNMHEARKIQLRSLPHNHMDIASTYSSIGQVYYDLKDFDQALSYCEKGLQIYERCRRQNSPDLAVSHMNMAMNLGHLKRFEEAIKHAEKALQISQSYLPSDHESVKERQQLLNSLHNALERSQKRTTNS